MSPGAARSRVAFVVQRYGRPIDGGSETLCREIAERLAGEADVEVLTTTAVDYLTWKNELAAGESREGGVVVRRFPVASRRWVRSFGRLSEKLYHSPHTIEDELYWMIRQGPRTPALLDYLKDSERRFDAFVFFTYLYYPTYFGLPLVAGRSVLVPTLHDEPPARFDIFRTLFRLPRAFVWQTPEERDFARERFGIEAPGEVAGYGLAVPAAGSDGGFGRRRGLGEYLLYLGRIDVWKGIPELVEHFARYRRERAPELSLVLAGSLHMKAPKGAGVLLAGYLEEGEKQQALAEALATVVPSSFESLSVVALESWAAGTPVVATARSRAVAGQCERSGGGLLYTSYEQFAAAVDRARSPERRALGESGRRFVATECSWERILGVYRRAIDRARGAPA